MARHESPRTYREHADDFIPSRTVKRVEPGTIRFYTFALKRFLERVDASGAHPEDFGPRELRAFLTFLDKEG